MISSEKMKILEMLQEGTIKADEAAKLLDALEESDEQRTPSEPGKVLKIKVSDKNTGAVKVNMGLPLGFARFLKDLIPASERARIESQGVDLDAVFTSLDSGAKGKLVDVEDVRDGHLIEIWIE
ncbi:MAG: hypothetical protein JSV89_20170 [Spirochaetaceae bacterium]|nr:MAG: hypothetical protein JSV89_20170 [Spirochaetaceae bacterium]